MRAEYRGRSIMTRALAALLLFAMLVISGAGAGLRARAAYNDTNLNTFIHNGESIPEGVPGLPLTIHFRFGYDGVQGLYNPSSEYIQDVNISLSNDQTYLGVQLEVGTSKSAFLQRLENLFGEDIDSEMLDEYYQGYLDGYHDTSNGTVLYNYPVDSGSYPFEVDGQLFRQSVHFDEVKKGEYKDVSLTVTVRRDTKEGYYAIPIAFTYKLPHVTYSSNKSYPTHVEYINVYIRPESGDSGNVVDVEEQFAIGENQLTPSGTYPEVMNYGINLRNKKETVYDVTVSLQMSLGEEEMKPTAVSKSSANRGFPFDINETNYDRYYDQIEKDEVVNVPYSMAISQRTASGFYPLSYVITYRKIKGGQLYTETHTSYVRVRNASMETEDQEDTGEWNANKATKARIIVKSYTTVPEKIYAGDSFELNVEFQNASSDIDASNILFTFTSEETSDKSAVFASEGGANSSVVNSLKAGESATVKMHYTAKAGVNEGSYKITVKEQYDSPEFKNAEESVTIDIPVHQISRFSTSSFEVLPASLSVGSDANVMFGINNTGKVNLYNVSVTIKADSIRETTAYIGNIEPGHTGNVDVMVSAVAPTTDDGKVTAEISYEDVNGNVTTEQKEFELFVTEAMDMGYDDMYMDDSMFQDQEPTLMDQLKANIVWVLIIALALILALVIIIKRIRKKKREQELMISDSDTDEDDSEY